jgi:hypothetical protein
MFLLPKGKPLAENVPIAKLQLPEALDKLKNVKLTGCAIFDFPDADCVLFYDDGNLISALLRRNKTEQSGAVALTALVDLMIRTVSGRFTVHSFSKKVNQAVLSLICGVKVICNQELKNFDLKSLLERIKKERMTATLKICTDQRFGMILYNGGEIVGYYHDTAQAIDTSAGEVQKIAAMSGASADLFVIADTVNMSQDLSGLVNIRSLWASAKGDAITFPDTTTHSQQQVVSSVVVPSAETGSSEIEGSIIAIANSIVGKLGKALVEKELMKIGGIKALKNENKLSEFLIAISNSSKLLASFSKIKEMCDSISTEAAKL